MNRFALLIFTLLLASCANRSTALQESVENYAKAIRRGDPEIALSLVAPEKRDELAHAFERIDRDLMVSQVEIKSVVPDEKMENAAVTFMMEYFDQSNSNLVVMKAASLWKYDEEKKGWFLHSTTPLK
jgi:hypothetical protein